MSYKILASTCYLAWWYVPFSEYNWYELYFVGLSYERNLLKSLSPQKHLIENSRINLLSTALPRNVPCLGARPYIEHSTSPRY